MSTSGSAAGHADVQHVAEQGYFRSVRLSHQPGGHPLLHTHLVVANCVQGPDGRWTALDGRDLYRHRLVADAIYRVSY